ncbi:PREDICTED: uncharacterized protein LOC105954917 [Erythranthe guttata]|uniref:uncharacterized protein LOC105954917 n=1 Tax=Erythranthe guttata TaxID=4155 RepID=UPI00064DC896|nr:PREDICTED: uncharacterized protein LOC105954917 [Erythranthe guttata]|eukprot:XP_012834055.1 PREDICTED: uncharacterized protein LOC105954917 [Erythranthe guttata]
MDGIVENLAQKFSLTLEEEDGIVVTQTLTDPRAAGQGMSLVGRIVTTKEISFHTIKSNVTRLLQPVKGCSFSPIGPNRFVIYFEHPLDLKHAKSGCPWILEKNALLLQELDQNSDPTTTDIIWMPIVVRLHHIPIGQRSVLVATLMGNKIGSTVEVLNANQLRTAQFIRVKVTIDVMKSLKRGMYLHTVDGSKTWISFTYERLPNFCFLCGVLGHGENRCPTRYEENFVDPGTDLPYGTWLRASTLRDGEHTRLPLQPLPTNRMESPMGNNEVLRGGNIFSFSGCKVNSNVQPSQSDGSENIRPAIIDGSMLVDNVIEINAMPYGAALPRKQITVQKNNRKKKADGPMDSEKDRLNKKMQLSLRDEDVNSTAETAELSRVGGSLDNSYSRTLAPAT